MSRVDVTVRRAVSRGAHRVRLDEVSVLASYSLLLSVMAVAVAAWLFAPLLLALVTNVSTGDVEHLSRLSPSPAVVEYHNQYRQLFTAVVIFSVLVWYPVAKLVRKGQSPHWGFFAGGFVATCVALAGLHFPYRLLYANKSFEAVTWQSNHCYITGERTSQVLLFCPEVPPPRNRIVKVDEPGLLKLGVRKAYLLVSVMAPGIPQP